MKSEVALMNIETVWTYTGFAVLLSLSWLATSAMIWAGIQFLFAAFKNSKRYWRIVKLPEFFKEHPDCKKKFDEWIKRKKERDIDEKMD